MTNGTTTMVKVGIIGGSGLDDPGILSNPEIIQAETPYGKPTSALSAGKINGVDVVLISRHGEKHTLSPSQVNYRANICALRDQGATHILATTACGSLKEEIKRGDFVIVDQFIDFTKHRKITFHDSFENGAVHTPMAEPFDLELRQVLYRSARDLNYETHFGGTLITIEGPRFSTRAESKMFQMWGGDVINMSIATEAILANEAKIPYAVVAMSTDYDCWKEDEAPVSWEEILEIFDQNAHRVKKLLVRAVSAIT
jgi:5'-methylthioadenosine phosphorylase